MTKKGDLIISLCSPGTNYTRKQKQDESRKVNSVNNRIYVTAL